ncbi:MAG: hypothetical protein ACXWT1_15355 [Methylobacter sp.]
MNFINRVHLAGRYWDIQIRDECGYVKRPIDRPFSTLHRHMQTGVPPEHWANDEFRPNDCEKALNGVHE